LKICLNSFDKNSYIELIAFIKNTTPDTWEHSLSQFITLTEALDIDFKSLLEQYQSTVVFPRKELKINGNDLLGYGVKSGPDIKRILDECYSLILFKPELNNLDFLSEFVKQEIVGPL
jgi:hypothetical protein